MGLVADLGGGPVGVDTAIFVHFIKEHPRFLPLLEPLFREVSEGGKELVTSALTLFEVLAVPCRSGDHLLAGRYETLLTQSRGVHVADISRDHLRAAAQLRATTGVKTRHAQLQCSEGTSSFKSRRPSFLFSVQEFCLKSFAAFITVCRA